jgi:hypothetical protein
MHTIFFCWVFVDTRYNMVVSLMPIGYSFYFVSLIEYWYAKILTYSPSDRMVHVDCFIEHLIEFYERNLIKFPSKEKYIKKMLYMLHSVQKPFDIDALK